jgi:beta-glucosidase
MAEILFGITNPSGRLPFTYPAAINQIPINYWHTTSVANTNAQWNFGQGLSYSTFEYSNLRLSASSITFGTPVTVTVTVTNRGPFAGREAVLMFLTDDFRTIAPEAKLLKVTVFFASF